MLAVKHCRLFHLKTSICHWGSKVGESKPILVLSCGGALFPAGKRLPSRFRTNSRCQESPFSCPLQRLFPRQKLEFFKILQNYFLKVWLLTAHWWEFAILQNCLFQEFRGTWYWSGLQIFFHLFACLSIYFLLPEFYRPTFCNLVLWNL